MTHDHDHQHAEHPTGPGSDPSVMWTKEYWDDKYAAAGRLWSGNPNPRLVEQVADLTPGTAYDVGCGEGADAIWLAGRGWTVTGLDISQVALDRAAAHAEESGVADRTSWRRLDLMDPEQALPGDADLVSAQFVHAPALAFDDLYGRISAAVRTGGSLLVVGHHPDDMETGLRHPEMPDLLFTPERVVAMLRNQTGADWEVRHAGAPTRDASDKEGKPVTVTDTVVHAIRR